MIKKRPKTRKGLHKVTCPECRGNHLVKDPKKLVYCHTCGADL
jgi:ribosomal protein S27E